MRTVLRILRLDFIPANTDLGLLVLRVWLGLSLLILHGWGKLTGFSAMSEKFADPFGLGPAPSLALAVLGEFFASALLVLGLFSRLAALMCATTMAVAWVHAHDMILRGPKSGELAFIYLAGFVVLVLAGPGRFALDAKLGKTNAKA